MKMKGAHCSQSMHIIQYYKVYYFPSDTCTHGERADVHSRQCVIFINVRRTRPSERSTLVRARCRRVVLHSVWTKSLASIIDIIIITQKYHQEWRAGSRFVNVCAHTLAATATVIIFSLSYFRFYASINFIRAPSSSTHGGHT